MYNALNIPFNTPFVWNIIEHKDFMKLLQSIREINFLNYKSYLMPQRRSINIEIFEDITVKFIHYIENSKYNEPTRNEQKNSRDIYCKNIIDSYFTKKYINRVGRMCNDMPYIFVLDCASHSSFAPDRTKQEQLDFISEELNNDDIRILLTTDTSIQEKNEPKLKIIYTKTENNVINAKSIINTYKDLFKQINPVN